MILKIMKCSEGKWKEEEKTWSDKLVLNNIFILNFIIIIII